MIVRRLFHGLPAHPQIDPALDLVFAATHPDAPPLELLGYMAIRPAYYAHSFYLPQAPGSRAIADALFRHVTGYCAHARDSAPPGSLIPAEALFHVVRDNVRMQEYISHKGAVVEPDSPLIYRYAF